MGEGFLWRDICKLYTFVQERTGASVGTKALNVEKIPFFLPRGVATSIMTVQFLYYAYEGSCDVVIRQFRPVATQDTKLR